MQFALSFFALIFLAMIVSGICIPTSVLAKNTELNNKAKRSSNDKGSSGSAATREHYDFNNHKNANADLISVAASDTASLSDSNNEEQQHHQKHQNPGIAPVLQKRGINSQMLYGGADLYNYPISSGALTNGGVWSDEIDPPLMYSDLQDLQDEYPRGQYRSANKGYENLQNILNSEAYLEPFAMPLQYPSRYYGDRKKRSNSKYDMRLKRESKLTPADMLALVALVEAGERSRKESESENYIPESYFAPKAYYPGSFEYPASDDNDLNNSWMEPSGVDYYGMPYNMEPMTKYELAREHKYGTNRFANKRFMVSKKKRSLGSNRFLTESNNILPERFGKLNKSKKYF